jgi:hypothetical protein
MDAECEVQRELQIVRKLQQAQGMNQQLSNDKISVFLFCLVW